MLPGPEPGEVPVLEMQHQHSTSHSPGRDWGVPRALGASPRAARAVTDRAQMGLGVSLCFVLSPAAAPSIPEPLEAAEGHGSASVPSLRLGKGAQPCAAGDRREAGLSLRMEQPGNCCQEDSQVFVLTGP